MLKGKKLNLKLNYSLNNKFYCGQFSAQVFVHISDLSVNMLWLQVTNRVFKWLNKEMIYHLSVSEVGHCLVFLFICLFICLFWIMR